ncbi:hypothetical protein M0L20_08930 [Spirosoma sp. RP8]|uniref:Lipoprotein n=1 Tax=Spirosoma liriopis TaxID=2937440 RepID=A0ABT0HII5_9BACT|nr:hypothetical protein [Spirosoma liriopis]MCK8491971.1 hypothetical protein [Spirosoma liriopis]
MKLRVINMLLLAALIGCTTVSPEDTPTADDLIIRTGTSFGFCVGYCVRDYTFKSTVVTLTQKESRKPPQNPEKTCQATISQTDWNALKALANLENFSKQPERLGCPDCADGGAEYIELQSGDKSHRVTFEYNGTIPGFESFVEALRAQRAAYKECP